MSRSIQARTRGRWISRPRAPPRSRGGRGRRRRGRGRSPRAARDRATAGSPSSTNCGSSVVKVAAIFGLRRFVRSPARKAAGASSARRSGCDRRDRAVRAEGEHQHPHTDVREIERAGDLEDGEGRRGGLEQRGDAERRGHRPDDEARVDPERRGERRAAAAAQAASQHHRRVGAREDDEDRGDARARRGGGRRSRARLHDGGVPRRHLRSFAGSIVAGLRRIRNTSVAVASIGSTVWGGGRWPCRSRDRTCPKRTSDMSETDIGQAAVGPVADAGWLAGGWPRSRRGRARASAVLNGPQRTPWPRRLRSPDDRRFRRTR